MKATLPVSTTTWSNYIRIILTHLSVCGIAMNPTPRQVRHKPNPLSKFQFYLWATYVMSTAVGFREC
jgi:hypothetical protein